MSNNNDILKFIDKFELSTNKGANIEFDDHRFLLDILRDDSKVIVIQKATQVGVSFTVTIKSLYVGYGRKINIIYVLPTAGDARDFVVSKFDPIVENSKLLSTVKKTIIGKTTVWNAGLKKIGDSYYFFRGAQSDSKAQSIDGDMIVNDEFDFQPEETRKMFQERLEGSSSLGYNYCVGYPVLKGSGINEMFERSTQNEWYIKCPECGKEQMLNFPGSIDMKKQIYICDECGGEITDDARKKGRWIPKFPESKISGYHISKMIAPWIPASKILKSFKDDTPTHFYNYTLGLPHQDAKTTLTKRGFEKMIISPLNLGKYQKDSYKVVGIDQGNRFHYCEGLVSPSGSVITRVEIFNSEDELREALESCNPDKVVMDMSPNRWTTINLQKHFGKERFHLANIRLWNNEKILKYGHFNLKRSEGMVDVERTESLEYMFESMIKREIKIKNGAGDLDEVYGNLKNMVPARESRRGVLRKVFQRAGPDDYGFAINMFYVGCRMIMPESSKIIQKADNEPVEEINPEIQKAINNIMGGNRNCSIIIRPKQF